MILFEDKKCETKNLDLNLQSAQKSFKSCVKTVGRLVCVHVQLKHSNTIHVIISLIFSFWISKNIAQSTCR